jgi:hypothetical protein
MIFRLGLWEVEIQLNEAEFCVLKIQRIGKLDCVVATPDVRAENQKELQQPGLNPAGDAT